ncbi:MAG: phosphoglycerate dehydrogenase [Flavobacteriia bacterium]|nr:phosphoglycerate dehydrogenase [Flavobacteriia bacterium]
MKIVFLDEVHSILTERLQKSGFECLHIENASLEESQKYVHDADGIVIRSKYPMNEDFLKFAPHLKFIARSGAGMENIDIPYCESRNIHLFNSPEGNRNAVAEHALGMLLALMNNIKKSNKEITTGIWDREGNRGIELDGKTVGIIGYGNNGKAFAKKLRGFDVNVLAYDKYKDSFGSDFVKECTLEAILDQADVISFHIPQNQETVYFADETFFKSLAKPIFLLNLSRGKIVNAKALVEAIQNGQVLGAGLDVIEYEKTSFEAFFEQNLPEPFQFLLNAHNVILTPHIGGWTNESYFKLSNVLADKILDFYPE